MIREAIDVFQKKNDTFRLASRELTVAEPVSCINSRNMEFFPGLEAVLKQNVFHRQRSSANEPLAGSETMR